MSTPRERPDDEINKRIKRESDAGDHLRRRYLSGLTGSLNTTIPCAACKLLRRRCAQECPFSPYFSPHEPQKFASVHKIFGASNVSKMLMEVPETQRADAANSLVYEANVRLRDPVHGCMGAISALQQQVQALEAELGAVRAEILRHKYRQAKVTVLPTSNAAMSGSAAAGIVSLAAPAPLPPPYAPPWPPDVSACSSFNVYTAPPPPPPNSTASYSSITNDVVPYFG